MNFKKSIYSLDVLKVLLMYRSIEIHKVWCRIAVHRSFLDVCLTTLLKKNRNLWKEPFLKICMYASALTCCYSWWCICFLWNQIWDLLSLFSFSFLFLIFPNMFFSIELVNSKADFINLQGHMAKQILVWIFYVLSWI